MRRTQPRHRSIKQYRFKETVLPDWQFKTQASQRSAPTPDAEPYYRSWVDRQSHKHENHQFDAPLEVASMARSYRHYFERYNQLIGRKYSWDAPGIEHVSAMGPWEVKNDQRYRGVDLPAARLAAAEPFWTAKINDTTAHVQSRAFAGPAILQSLNGDTKRKARELRTAKTKTDTAAFWTVLEKLVAIHGPAVGDYEPGRPRNLRHIHEFFVNFHHAITSHKNQDAYLATHLNETRPDSMRDVFGLFLSLEANALDHSFCPRCNQSYTETSHCGEGDPHTPFRKHRGVPAEHKEWGKEWYDVYANRAEALWYRAAEDPFFGDPDGGHTQLQVESLLKVYCLTKQRGKANAFMARLQGSREFLSKRVAITKEMQAMYDTLLDSTPHPVLLTGSSKSEPDAAKYIGEGANTVPQSARQLRIEYEVMKARRTQREEGVVRIPPQGWKVDLAPVEDYKTATDGSVTNWRSVKKGLEKSIAASGLPPNAWTAAERREMRFLEQRIARAAKDKQAVARELAADRAKGKAATIEFPDAEGIRVFDISETALKPFGVRHCQAFVAQRRTFSDPTHVQADIGGSSSRLNITDHLCCQFGYVPGTKIELDEDGASFTAIVIGVDVAGAPESWSLLASKTDDPDDVVRLGTDIMSVRANHPNLRVLSHHEEPPVSNLVRGNAIEDFEGVVVGVRDGVLFAQFDGSSVATPMGRASAFTDGGSGKVWRFDTSRKASVAAKLVEPFSWNVPFRNDRSEERLEELRKAPWTREAYAPLTPNRFTPKVKRFGYTQHTTQDDFVTREYKDRLASKQVFTDAERFKVFPDRVDETVRFSGKNEPTVTHGVPTVDRRELDEGWGEAAAVPAHEAEAIEQAIRDISGRRPGNFVKTPNETSSLELSEEWWQPLAHGLQQTQSEDEHLHPAMRRRLGDVPPFGGQRAAANTTMGIMERYEEITKEWSKGFDLGPHGMSAGANDAHYDTLESQTQRAAALQHNMLVAMFNHKLQEENLDVFNFSSRYGSDATGETNPKVLITSINEWRERGRAPSLTLSRVLKQYLAPEMAAYNEALPAGVPALDIRTDTGIVAHANVAGAVAADRDPVQAAIHARLAAHDTVSAGVQEFGYITAKYLAIACDALPRDNDVTSALRARFAADFRHAITAAVGDGVPNAVQQGRSDRATDPKRLVLSTNLEAILTRFGFKHADRARIIAGLHAHVVASDQKAERSGFFVDAETILRWKPSNEGQTAAASSSSSRSTPSVAQLDDGQRAGSSGGPQRGGLTVPAMLESLSRNHDGYVQDIQYAAHQNAANPAMRDAFRTLFFDGVSGVFTAEQVDRAFELYCHGRYVPSSDAVVGGIVSLLEAAAASLPDNAPDSVVQRQKSARKMLRVDEQGRLAGVVPRPLDETPFKFDNVRDTYHSVVEKFRKWGIAAGPDNAPPPPFLATSTAAGTVDNADFCVSFSAEGELASFDDGDYGLHEHITKSSSLATLCEGIDKTKATLLADGLSRRCLGALSDWAKVRDTYRNRRDEDAMQAGTLLKNLLHEEDDTKIEESFRQNADRYWREQIDGRGRTSIAQGGPQRRQFGRDGGARGGSPTRRNSPPRQSTNLQRAGSPGSTRGGSGGRGRGSGGRGGGDGNYQRNRAGSPAGSTTGLGGGMGRGSGRGGGRGRGGPSPAMGQNRGRGSGA